MTPAKAPLPFLGTWKLATCETSRPDLPHPTSGVTTFSQQNDGIHYSAETVWSDGRTTNASCVFPVNGDWCAISGSSLSDSASMRISGATFEVKMKKAGADTGTVRATVSADGRTTTGSWELAGPGGTATTWKTTSERQ